MQKCDLVLSADILVTQNENRDIFYDAAVAVKGGKICGAGSRASVDSVWAAEKHRTLGASLIMPGLTNTHTHLPMSILRGLADDMPLMDWLRQEIFPREAKLTPAMLEVGTLLSCAEMLRTGITSVCDMYLNEAYIYRALDQAGLRALVGECIFAFPSIGCPDPSAALESAREQARELRENPRLRYAICPHSIYTTNMDILEKCAKLAEELELPLHLHLAETPSETAQSLELYGMRPTEVCLKAGLLGPRTIIAHGVDLNEDEMALLAQYGCSVAHNPRSNMKLASGLAPVPRLLAQGVNVALGTDGAASNNGQNMFAEMSACALLHKLNSRDPTTLPAQTVLDMGTLNGALAMGLPEAGRLVPGAPADLIALDLEQPNLIPMSNPVSHLVYAAGGSEVMLTMVDGKILYDNGSFTSLDYPALLREARALHNWLRAQG